MAPRSGPVGREAELAQLGAALERARAGAGSVVLLRGEAGVGKTRLAAEAAARSDALLLRGAASRGGSDPYAAVVGALRGHLRSHAGALDGCGPLRAHLAILLPELGHPAPGADRPTLFEALRCALGHLAADGHALVVLDDLQWSDAATLELLAALAEPLAELPVAVFAAYRSDAIPRDHGIRRLRHDLRRAGRLEEVVVPPLDAAGTAELLGRLLGGRPSPALARAVQERTGGLPFFVEELAAALRVSGGVQAGPDGLVRAGAGDVPLPETVRDAVRVGIGELSPAARAAADAAAVAGDTFSAELVAALAGEDGLAELVAHGVVQEDPSGRAGFRHALTREALLTDVPRLRRRTLHRQIAEALERDGGADRELATHWLGAGDRERARAALLRAAASSQAVHAYRDAAAASREALELWPAGDLGQDRATALERLGRCAELCGDLAPARRAWAELLEQHAAGGDDAGVAEARRRLAGVHELEGDREAAFLARQEAAAAYEASGQPAEAAVELLAMANARRLAARHAEAVGLARSARVAADAARRVDLRIRSLGLEGLAEAKHGDYAAGLAKVRGGLALALEHELTAVAAELYQRLSVALYEGAELRGAEEALDTALDLCRSSPDAGTEVACVSCMAYVLRERGDWARAAEICRELIDAGTVVFVAEGLLGAIHACQGKLSSARRLLGSCLAVSARVSHYNMTLDSTAALARVAAADGDAEEVARHCRAVLELWSGSDDRHYAVPALRWATAALAAAGDRAGAHACTDALSRIAAATGHADALAALAHAIAETALLEGDADTAAEQLTRAVEVHRALDMPFERAQIELRAGVALCAAGEREIGLERLCDAYRTARKLGARPLAGEAAREVAALGESVVVRLGRHAAADAEAGGLSRREREVVRMLAAGRTNREIAHDLFLSPRTVDMHVRNILRKLGCRSRVEAAGRARELGLTA